MCSRDVLRCLLYVVHSGNTRWVRNRLRIHQWVGGSASNLHRTHFLIRTGQIRINNTFLSKAILKSFFLKKSNSTVFDNLLMAVN